MVGIDKIKELLAAQLSISADEVSAEKEIVKDLGADSLDIVEMLMTLEEEYGVTIPDEETVDIKTVGDIVRVLDKYVK
ncbi:MAG: acyl carrier protein [Bacillota bacterium]|nr:MAG: acyl carrier protein [Bacillota bacterium]